MLLKLIKERLLKANAIYTPQLIQKCHPGRDAPRLRATRLYPFNPQSTGAAIMRHPDRNAERANTPDNTGSKDL